MKTIDIFLKSYAKDFPLLKYALMSIQKYVTGYSSLIIVVDENDGRGFTEHILHYCPKNTAVWFVQDKGNGYLWQQVCKLKAHKYSNAEYIMFSDSDCIFDHHINLQDFIAEDKPEILYTDYNKVGQAICWKEPTEAFIDDVMPWELMRRNCLIYHRSTLLNLGYFCKEQHDRSIEDYVMESGKFSEYNAIGAYAFLHEPGKYNFVNTDEWQYTPPKGEQLWSWAEKNGNEESQKEYQRSIETINKALDLNIQEI